MNSSTGYENAPATLMVATDCACCGRPLVDSVSVETGVGPICRKRHGFNEAQAPADWAKAAKIMGEMILAFGDNQRKATNVLVHRIAVQQSGEQVCLMVQALAALGFTKLAGVIAYRLAGIKVETEEGRYIVFTPYNADLVADMQKLEGRRWDSKNKANTFPLFVRDALWKVLIKHFPGKLVIGCKGVGQLPMVFHSQS